MIWWQPPTLYILIAVIVVLSIPAFLLRKRMWGEIKRWQATEISIFGMKLTRKADSAPAAGNLSAGATVGTKGDLQSSLPAKRYHALIGRDEEIQSILATLRDTNGKRLLAIVGMGGIGKSALTREALERATQEKLFRAFWWTTAKQQSLEVLDELSPDKNVSYETLLKRLMSWLGLGAELQKETKLASQEALVRKALSGSSILIVLDNLETAEDQDKIAERFAFLLQGTPSRAILTSREDFKGLGASVVTHSLKGLGEASAIQLMQDVARENGSQRALEAREGSLRKIVRAVGGMPLALKLAVGLLEVLDTTTLLDSLEKIQSEKVVQLYEYLFASAWRALTDAQKDMLVAISIYDENEGVRARHLREAQIVPDDQFADVLQHLASMSLIEISGGVNSTRYTLHPLTLNFIRTQNG